MPRMRAIGVGALGELALQLRYAPKGAVARHIREIEALSLEVVDDEVFSEEWIVRRITGYAQEIESPAMIVGRALRGDLSALAERISAGARLRDGDVGGKVLGVGAVCARWGVSRKTVERWRRRGLIGVRTTDGLGHTRVVFRLSAVEGFERREQDLVARAGSFARTGVEECAKMREAARGSTSASRSGAISAASAAVGRSRGAAARALRGVFEEGGVARARGVLGAHDRREVADLYICGAPAAAIGARYGKSAASVRRIGAEVRAERLRALRLAEWDLDDGALEAGVVCRGLLVKSPGDLRGVVEMASGGGPVGRGEEAALARGYRALVARAGARVRGVARFGSSVREIDAAERELRWAAMVKRRLVCGEMGLIVRTVEERAGEKLERMDRGEGARLFAIATRAVIGAVDVFDPAHGGRLAAPAGVMMARALGKGGGADGFARGGLDWRDDVAPWCGVTDMPDAVRNGLDGMGEDVRSALTRFYGLDGDAPVLLREACKEAGVTVKKVRRAVWGMVEDG